MVGAEGQVEMMLARQPLGGDVLQRPDHDAPQRLLGPGVVGQKAFLRRRRVYLVRIAQRWNGSPCSVSWQSSESLAMSLGM